MPEFAELLRGYERFRHTIYPRQKARYDELVRDGQHPELMIIGCSDSRVDPAQIFDVEPGSIFVMRNIAALVPPFETTPGLHGVSAGVEFAVQMLEVKQIVVMGHDRCGGCKAALTRDLHGNEPGDGGLIMDWIGLLEPVRMQVASIHGTSGDEAERAMEMEAVRLSLSNLRTFPWVAAKERSGALKLRGAFFAISEGVLHVLDEESGKFEPIE